MHIEFSYEAPSSVRDLLRLLSDGDDRTKIYAGGTDLLISLRANKVSVSRLIDIKRIRELRAIDEQAGWLRIGAAASFSEIEKSPLIAKSAPALAAAAASVGSVQLRFKATLGGNIQTASPAGDGLTALWGLDAEVELLSEAGRRRVRLDDFVRGPGVTTLHPGEVITAVCVPVDGWHHQSFFKVGRRAAMAIAVVNGVVALETDAGGRIGRASISVGAAAPTPMRVRPAEELLVGERPTEAMAQRAGEIVRQSVRPITDIRGGASYRASVAGAMVTREILAFQGAD